MQQPFYEFTCCFWTDSDCSCSETGSDYDSETDSGCFYSGYSDCSGYSGTDFSARSSSIPPAGLPRIHGITDTLSEPPVIVWT